MRHYTEHSQKINQRLALLYVTGCIVLLLAALLGLALGSTDIGINELLHALFSSDKGSPEMKIFIHVRLPRTLSSMICGAALSVSGAVIQGVLANKLASPSIIGVNSGAGLAVTLCAAFGVSGGVALSLWAFVGALSAVMLISAGAKKWGASSSKGTVILMGVALNALLGAISDAVTIFSPEIAIQSFDFKMGDFSSVTYKKLIPATVIILISLLILITLSNELDALSLGDENAKGLGLNTSSTSALLLVLSALLAGASVSIAGLLSFVGLLVPHTVRRVSKMSKHLIPLCALFGAGFVCICDTVARTVFAPYELPVGIIMAFLGAPFFIFILIKGKGGYANA